MEKYKKVKVVGKGSFGYALLVQSIQNKRPYIIKIIDISKMDRKQREEALNEVLVLKAMRHPYIITYRESFMEKKCLCIVMDYADGGDLYAKIAKQKEIGTLFTEDQILDWFVQMALAMNHIHERKILHRDLKTQNIFLTSKCDVKIGDFGIARVLQHTYDCAQTAIGTPYYLSPEICQEKPYNQKSDIWSLGCILYELTTLNHAFDAISMKELVLKILRGTYPPISPQYSTELQGLIAEMLIKDPSKRPSIKRILEKDFLKARIGNLLVSTLSRHELMDLKKLDQQDEKEQNISQISQLQQQRQPMQCVSRASNNSQYQSNNNSPITQRQQVSIGQNSKSPIRQMVLEKKPPTKEEVKVSKIIPYGNIIPQDPLKDKLNTNQLQFSRAYYQNQKENIASKQPTIENSSNIQIQKLIKGKEVEKVKEKERERILSRDCSKEKDKFEEQMFQQNSSVFSKQKANLEIIKKGAINNLNYKSQLTNCDDDDSLESQGYGFLIKDMKRCLDKKKKKQEEEEEIFADNFKLSPQFLSINGKSFVVPGTSERDTIGYKIEALRVYLEKHIGVDLFMKAYKMMEDSHEQQDSLVVLNQMLSQDQKKYIPLIIQLIVCEDSYYLNS